MYDYEIFLENMERYEAGERELNAEEQIWQENLQSEIGGVAPLPFEIFLEHMEMYNSEKSTHKHI